MKKSLLTLACALTFAGCASSTSVTVGQAATTQCVYPTIEPGGMVFGCDEGFVRPSSPPTPDDPREFIEADTTFPTPEDQVIPYEEWAFPSTTVRSTTTLSASTSTLPVSTSTSTTTSTSTISTSTTTSTSTTITTTTVPTTSTSTSTTVSPCLFTGFFSPVDNAPVVNVVKAGAAVPVKFGFCQSGLLQIFASGAPSSSPHICGTAATDEIESTVTVSTSGLTFDATSGRYQYNWKTDRAWASQCRTLTLRFNDGTTKTAEFKFR